MTPAGLSQDTLALTLAVNSYAVRLARRNAAQMAAPQNSLLVVEFPSEEVLGAREKMFPKDQSGQAVVADELTISR